MAKKSAGKGGGKAKPVMAAKPKKRVKRSPASASAPAADVPRETPAPKKLGRPSTYNAKTTEQIIELLADGTPLAVICRMEGMPKLRTVYDWESAHGDFSARIARARLAGFDNIAADALRIADTQVLGERTKRDEDGIEVTTEDMLGHRKLQIETRLKLLAKWDPRRYGDKVELTGEGGGPIRHDVDLKAMKPLEAYLYMRGDSGVKVGGGG